MSNDTVVQFRKPGEFVDVLSELLREGAHGQAHRMNEVSIHAPLEVRCL